MIKLGGRRGGGIIPSLVMDGLWPLMVNLGSKVQGLIFIAVAARLEGSEGVAQVSLGLAWAILAATAADFGYSPELARYLATCHTSTAIKSAVAGIRRRVPIAGGLIFALIVLPWSPLRQNFETGLFLGVYASSFLATQAMSQVLYSLGHFKSSGNVLASCRTAGAVVAASLLLLNPPSFVILWVAALSESIAAAAMYMSLTRKTRHAAHPVELDPPHGRFYWLGLSSLLNVGVNRSDVIIVSAFGGAQAVAVYSFASQIENALTGIVLMVATPVAYRAARAQTLSEVKAIVLTCIKTIGMLTVIFVGAIGAMIAVAASLNLTSNLPMGVIASIIICLGAAFPNSQAGGLFALTRGLGATRGIALSWTLVALVAIPAFAVVSALAPQFGAAVAAAIRDLTLFTCAAVLALLHVRRRANKRPTVESAIS